MGQQHLLVDIFWVGMSVTLFQDFAAFQGQEFFKVSLFPKISQANQHHHFRAQPGSGGTAARRHSRLYPELQSVGQQHLLVDFSLGEVFPEFCGLSRAGISKNVTFFCVGFQEQDIKW